MSDIDFKCPSCKQELQAPTSMSGQTIECPNCNKPLIIPQTQMPQRETYGGKPRRTFTVPKGGLRSTVDQSSSRTPTPKAPVPTALIVTIAILLVLCVGLGVGMFIMFHARNVTTPPIQEAPAPVTQTQAPRTPLAQTPDKTASAQPTSSSLSIFQSGKEDDQFYEYTKVKAANTESPQEKAALLQEYLGKYPTGRHTGEIKALLEIAQKEVAKPKTFAIDVTVKAFTLKGNNYPNHSITYELLVNGEKIRSLDNDSTSMKFASVSVKVGDIISGRALWRNGYGSVGKVNETPKETMHTVIDKDQGNSFNLQTYENGLYLGPEWY